jgi:Ternary complex associated domain 9
MTAPTVEVVEEMLEAPQREAVQRSAEKLLAAMCASSDSDGGWNLREIVWPALALCGKGKAFTTRLVLMPLDRIGGEPGRSGNKVMIAYFEPIDSPAILRSQPLVLKVSSEEMRFADKLKSEWEQAKAIRPHLAYHKDAFAVPVFFHDERPAVLWSPFSSNRELWATAQREGTLKIRELWEDLNPAASAPSIQKEQLISILDGVYALLWPLHQAGGTGRRKNIEVLREYGPYLRHVHEPWAEQWRGLWGAETKETASDFDATDWVNPFYLLKTLKDFRADLWIGAVQGDLHPRNILLNSWNSPNVIDFGWASGEAHVAKDFALLECNLRFMTLPPSVSLSSVKQMAGWLGNGEPKPKVPEEAAKLRIDLIVHLREKLPLHLPGPTDWTVNYLLPLFLVAMGLLKHNVSCGHQEAARLTILHLAKHLTTSLKTVATSAVGRPRRGGLKG